MFLKTLREVIVRVYFVDLITLYKTIGQFPVVSIVNSRTSVIFQMWLPCQKDNKTSEKNCSDPAGGASELVSNGILS